MNLFSTILGGLGSLFGGAPKRRYTDAQSQLADLMAQQYRDYVPRLNRQLLAIIQRGGTSPAFDAESRQAESDTDAYFRQALADVLKAKGGAGLENSLQRQQATLALARGRASTLAQQRVRRLATQDARLWDALQLLAGTTRGSGGAALAGYQRLGDAPGSLGGVLRLLGGR